MTMDECINILTPALKALWGEAGNRIGSAKLLDDLLHRTEYHEYEGRGRNSRMSEEYKRELMTLISAGPNSQTILALIRVKRGLHDDGRKIPKDISKFQTTEY